MKKHLLSLLTLGLAACAGPQKWTDLPPLAFDPPPYARFLKGLKVCLDPGHGGDAHKKGYKRTKSGFREAIMNIRVARYLEEFLNQVGAKVIMTRVGDVDLSLADRAATALRHDADIFVSLHHNAISKPKINYTTIWYHGEDDYSPASLDAARCVYFGLTHHLRLEQLAPVPLNSDLLMYKSGFGVLRGIGGKIPALLTESSFFTNPAEEERLKDLDYNKREAWGIFLGLARWAFGGLPRAEIRAPGTITPNTPLRIKLDSGLQKRKSWSASRPHVLATTIAVHLDNKKYSAWDFTYPTLVLNPPNGGWSLGMHKLRVNFVNLFKNSVLRPELKFVVRPPSAGANKEMQKK